MMFLRKKQKEPTEKGRKVVFPFEGKSTFLSNYISNTKYNVLTFFPKNILEQFRRVANIYFLITNILILFPQISPFDPGGVWAAFAFVLLANLIKEGYEDLKRYKQDKEINNRVVQRVVQGRLQDVRWQDICVGDVLLVKRDQPFPADLLLLSSSYPDSMCYVSTLNLDGETNLKVHQALHITSKCKDAEGLSGLKGYIAAEDPTPVLGQFEGTLYLEGETPIPLVINNILIRETTLRNTEFIFGLVIYTGHETKYLLNAIATPSKRSRAEKLIDKFLFGLFAFLATIVIICTIASTAWIYTYGKDAWYFSVSESAALYAVKTFFTFLILFSGIIPIALFVTLEIVRIGQMFFINWDIDMYDEVTDTPAQCRNSNLNEELGQVRYILTDKTGTLTNNELCLRMSTIHGIRYGQFLSSEPKQISSSKSTFWDPKLSNFLDSSENVDSYTHHFLTAMLVCHSVLIGSESERGRDLQASSPDEIALVLGIESFGFLFLARTSDSITVKILGKEKTYQILNVLEFTSERKRMTMIVKTPEGEIIAYAKGADSTLYERLNPENLKEGYTEETSKDLLFFANSGLRTLAVAFKRLNKAEYEEWNGRYQAARLLLEGREEALAQLAEEMERNFTLLGGTGIEDRLADQVPETISVLLRAGIKIWMLTGDKQETAISVGKTCRLIEKQQIFILEGANAESIASSIETALEKFKGQHFALVVSGKTLKTVLEDSLRLKFLELASMASSVVCCRVSPLQKSLVTNLVKQEKREVTLAIGDGSNDVAMIQNAHVGVGIRGKEGSAAVLASDYSFAQFKSLKKLLLIHGRWSYYRISFMFVYLFYKQYITTLLQLWVCVFNGFSSQTYYDSLIGVGYHIVFTAYPVMVNAIFDQDVPKEILYKFPELYKQTQANLYFNQKVYWSWLALSTYCSIVIYFVNYCNFAPGVLQSNGHTVDLYTFSIALFSHAVVLANAKIALETKSWTSISSSVTLASVAAFYILTTGLYSGILPGWTNLFYGAPAQTYSMASYWLSLPIMLAFCLGPDLVFQYLRRTFFPLPHHIAQEVGKWPSASEIEMINLSEVTTVK